ncbi:MAG TPA: hypothetical protein VFA52_03185 [Candidatus Paceibacterota bacterium]|nr:hypothetical protein [Candidatus Paceibacterota bacterium]
MDASRMVEFVNGAALARQQPTLPHDYIVEALERIDKGKEKAKKYPTGSPSLKDTYDVAARLQSAAK